MPLSGSHEHVQTIVVRKDKTDSLTNFPHYLPCDRLNTAFWDTVASGGGDIRIFKDGVECPREVVSCDPVGKTGEVWFKADSSNIEDNLYDIYVDGSSPDYDHTAEMGRNAVWSGEGAAFHGKDSTDSTGTNTLTATASHTTGVIGDGFDLASAVIITDDVSVSPGNMSAYAIRGWYKTTTTGAWSTVFTKGGSARFILQRNNATGDLRLYHTAAFATFSGAWTTLADGNWHYLSVRWNGTTAYLQIDDGTELSAAFSTSPTEFNDNFAISAAMDAADEFRIRDEALSADWISAEYENQSSPDTFYDFGTDSADLTHVADITINSSEVSGDLTDYPVTIIPDSGSGWDSLWSNVDPDGSDLRFYKDGGAVELAAEIVSMDVAGESAEIHTKYRGTLPSDSNTVIKVYAGATDDYVPRHGFGRNRVWSDYRAVWHLGDTADATGNGNTLTEVAGVSYEDGPLGSAVRLDGAFDALEAADNTFTDNAPPHTLQVIAKPDVASSAGEFLMLLGKTQDNAESYRLMLTNDGGSGSIIRIRYPALTDSNTDSVQTWAAGDALWVSSTLDSGDIKLYRDGSEIASRSTTGTVGTNADPLRIGSVSGGGSGEFDGLLDEARLRAGALSASWIATEHSNQSAPNTFYTVTDPNAVGGTNVSASTATLTLTENASTVTLDVDVQASAASLTLTPLQATISTSDNTEVNTSLATLALTPYQASISLDREIQANTASLTLSTSQASITSGVFIEAATETLSLTTNPATIGRDVEVTTGTVSFDITTHSASVVASVKTVTCTLVSATGTALPNLTDLSYAWFDEPDPANLSTPVATGVTESTDGSGVIEVEVATSSLAQGQTGLLVLRSQDGTSLGAYNLAIQ